MRNFRDDEEFQKEYFELVKRYKKKYEDSYYLDIYKNIMNQLSVLSVPDPEAFKSAIACMGFISMSNKEYVFIDPKNPIMYYISDNKLHKVDNNGIALVTITPDLFEYFSKRSFVMVDIEED